MKKLKTAIKSLLLVVFLSGISHAEFIDKNNEIEVIGDFSGGLNTDGIPYKLQNNESPDMQNVYIDEEEGRLVTINGYTILGSTSGLTKVNFLFLFINSDYDKEYILSDSSRVLSTKDFDSYTMLRENLNANALISATQVRNKVWFTNGIDPVFTYNGSTVVVLNGSVYGGTEVPDVPKGKYIEYYQDRVWMYNINDNNSALYFTDLVSTNAVNIAPDHALAWPSENALYVGQGDGQSGTCLVSFKNRLFIGKERSIYVLNGIDEYSYFLSKTDAKVGISGKDSYTILDNLVYFKAKNEGIYAFDGNDSLRISDKINDEIRVFETVEANSVNLSWDNGSDFSKGVFHNSTVTDYGYVSVASTRVYTLWDFSSTTQPIASAEKFFSSEDEYTAYSTPSLSAPYDNASFLIVLSTYYAKWKAVTPTGGMYPLIKNIRTGGEINASGGQVALYPSGYDGEYYLEAQGRQDLPSFAQISSFTSADLNGGQLTVRYQRNPVTAGAGAVDGKIYLSSVPNTIGLNCIVDYRNFWFTSEISTATNITTWDSFDSEYDTNGGEIAFYYRTSYSPTMVSTQIWIPISAGSIISSSGTHIQWASSMTVSFKSGYLYGIPPTLPAIKSVNITYNTGGTSDSRSILSNWGNRVWVSGSTNGVNSTIYVKSKNTFKNSTSFTRIVGVDLKSLLNTGDKFYAGHSTWGAVMRLDYGTSFAGSTITAYYDTPDMVLGSNFFKKDLVKYLIDAEKESGNSLRIGTSIDGRAMTYDSISLDGSGRYLGRIDNVPDSCYRIRIRFENCQLDKKLRLNTFAVIYKKTQKGN